MVENIIRTLLKVLYLIPLLGNSKKFTDYHDSCSENIYVKIKEYFKLATYNYHNRAGIMLATYCEPYGASNL